MKKNEIYGTWEVYTEGTDVLDKVLIGTYTGYVDEIALSLADKSNYILEFKKVKDAGVYKPISEKVVIKFADSNIVNGDLYESYFEQLEELFNDRPVKIELNGVSNTFSVIADESMRNEIIRNKALSKLTDEEKEVLGIL